MEIHTLQMAKELLSKAESAKKAAKLIREGVSNDRLINISHSLGNSISLSTESSEMVAECLEELHDSILEQIKKL